MGAQHPIPQGGPEGPTKPIPPHHGCGPQPTSREEPVGMLDERLDDPYDLQRDSRHHLRHVPARRRAAAQQRHCRPALYLEGFWPRTPLTPFPSIPLPCSLSTRIPYPSACGQRRLGPSTMATLLGVILFVSWYSVSLARNLIRYLESRAKPCRCIGIPPSPSPPRVLLAPGSPDVVVVGFGQLLAGAPESLQPLLLLRDAAGRQVRGLSPLPTPGLSTPPALPLGTLRDPRAAASII